MNLGPRATPYAARARRSGVCSERAGVLDIVGAPYPPAGFATEAGGQYSLGKILGIWALAAQPMGVLSWIVFPALSPGFEADPLGAGETPGPVPRADACGSG
jgi:hypothetical protein